jgi:diaminopimelate decarboxylase
MDGPICESTDQLGVAPLPPLQRDDLVAIGVAGAYGSSMASTYNGRPRPPEVGWDDDGLRVLRPRGSRRSLP